MNEKNCSSGDKIMADKYPGDGLTNGVQHLEFTEMGFGLQAKELLQIPKMKRLWQHIPGMG